MPIKFTLQDTMNRYNITQKQLFEVSDVRMNTIRDIREGNAKALTVEKLDALIAALNEITGDKHDISSVLVYVEAVNKPEDGE